jgi:hypothetical protein
MFLLMMTLYETLATPFEMDREQAEIGCEGATRARIEPAAFLSPYKTHVDITTLGCYYSIGFLSPCSSRNTSRVYTDTRYDAKKEAQRAKLYPTCSPEKEGRIEKPAD